MFSPSAAPRWKSTMSFFLFGMGVAATARCKNAGIVLMPIIATPPLFRKTRRETFIFFLPCYSLFQGHGFSSLRCTCRGAIPSSSLELRRAEDQPGDHRGIHLLYRVVQARLENLRIVQLLFECVASLRRCLPGQEHLDSPIERRVRIHLRLIAE